MARPRNATSTRSSCQCRIEVSATYSPRQPLQLSAQVVCPAGQKGRNAKLAAHTPELRFHPVSDKGVACLSQCGLRADVQQRLLNLFRWVLVCMPCALD